MISHETPDVFLEGCIDALRKSKPLLMNRA